MGLVQAKMSFYHDSVGSRAQNEVFEIKNEKVCAELERAGYIQKANDEAQKAHQEQQEQQQQVGQKNAQANEAVSMANHNHNMAANQHTDNVKQFRATRSQDSGQAQMQSQAENAPKAVRKSDK